MEERHVSHLKNGGLLVMPTDTVYGLVADATNERAVARIYELKRREKLKPPVILIGEISQLAQLGLPADEYKDAFGKYWPGPTSIVLPLPGKRWRYLHRGKQSIAVRLPDDERLTAFLKRSGPLASSSANISHEPPARSIEEARRYFGEEVLYIDGGNLDDKPSRIIKLDGRKETVIRP